MFSPTELKVLRILRRKKMTISDIAYECYPPKGLLKPINPNNYVALVVRNITRKCEYHKLPWTLVGEGTGRHGRKVWREKV